MIEQIESLVSKVNSLEDREARQTALDLVQAIMDLHAAGLERMMDLATEPVLEAYVDDEKVEALLLLHGLHPIELEARVKHALESVRVTVLSRNASAHLLGVDEGRVRIRVDGANPFSGIELRTAIEQAIYKAAPDAEGLTILGIPEPESGFVPLATLVAAR